MHYLFSIITTLLFLAGCAANIPKLPKVTAAEQARVVAGAVLSLTAESYTPLPEVDIFESSDGMKRFVNTNVARWMTEDQKIRALLEAVLSPVQLGVRYEENATYTAREAFQQRRVNCLSFTIIMVSMLRYIGMTVAFNQVDVPPIWDLQGDTLILSGHVNAMVTRSAGGRKVVDINMQEYEKYYPQREVDDRIVAALYYNNRGMELMLAGDVLQSFRHLLKALELAPELPYIWTNLGTLYREQGRYAEAEIAYRLALERDPDNLVAISKAERNYSDLGDARMSAYFRERAVAFRQKNPYYLYSMAQNDLRKGNYVVALTSIQTAISRYNKEHRFFFLQGLIYSALADRKQADASFKKALELTSSRQQQDAYRRKMEKLI